MGSLSITQVAAQNTADTVLPDEKVVVSPGVETLEENAQADVVLTSSEHILQTLGEYLPGVPFSDVTESAIPGIYEAVADGQILYVDEAGEYIIQGEVRRLSDGANLTDEKLGRIHMGMIKAMDEQDMLIYEPEEPSERSITVFTDISCGYCRLLHEQLDTLLDEGVRVRYLLFPRGGQDSQGHKDLESVWCADNPQEAMTTAKAGGEIVSKSCDNPILSHMELAQRLGLRGTPLIYTDSGEKISGYREAAILAEMVNDTEPM